MDKRTGEMPSIRPASDLRTKFTQVMDEIYQSDEPVFLTKKGRCDTVIMSADTFAKYELTPAALSENYMRARDRHRASVTGKEKLLDCSFCGKSQDQLKRLIAGPGVSICDECIELCTQVLDDNFDPEF